MKNDSLVFKLKMLNQLLMTSMVNDEAKPANLPRPTQMLIIDYLWENEDKDIFQRDIEKKLNVSRATISDVLRTMEKYELVKRVPESNTKRVILLDKAKEYKRLADKKIKELEDMISNNISESDLEKFLSILDIMIKNIDKDALQE